VLDAADPGLQPPVDRRRGVGVPGDVPVGRPGLVDDRPQLLHRVLDRVDPVGGGGHPARQHHLDVVRPAPQLLPGRPADLGDAVGDHGEGRGAGMPVEQCPPPRPRVAVPAGLRQRLAAEEHPGPGQQPLGDRGRDPKVGPGHVAHGREPPVQHPPQDPGCMRGQVGRRPRLDRRQVGGGRVHVHVGVDQPRHDGHAPGVEDGAVPRSCGPGRSDVHHPAILDHHHLAPGQRSGLRVEHGGVAHHDPPGVQRPSLRSGAGRSGEGYRAGGRQGPAAMGTYVR
jgi:hypothetical protein